MFISINIPPDINLCHNCNEKLSLLIYRFKKYTIRVVEIQLIIPNKQLFTGYSGIKPMKGKSKSNYMHKINN
ncbi:hypothetical protein CLOHIR_00683 [Peptacetobacter hiranonis DSM 13275]|uniref:Uncharacterized protein n=1 Tax=Peptacetobacter hiranonis (strain DSM 13275 / JCM 10541 / KCTC 15199 / TO-931) TaxID=500633 RepID=B6FXT3_PEPHT|nr:hypothetical protein CLOHIR_00683 [Peptacetobacter hiranonis DSM 13275]